MMGIDVFAPRSQSRTGSRERSQCSQNTGRACRSFAMLGVLGGFILTSGESRDRHCRTPYLNTSACSQGWGTPWSPLWVAV